MHFIKSYFTEEKAAHISKQVFLLIIGQFISLFADSEKKYLLAPFKESLINYKFKSAGFKCKNSKLVAKHR